MSEFLVGAVEAARATLGLTEVFVGVIVIAVIGNAAEHSTAVVMAMKNKMGLSVGIGYRVKFADRALCRPGARLFFLSFRPADGSGVHIAGGCGGDCRRVFNFSNQRRWRNELA